MGVSTALWNLVRACLNTGMRRETILGIIKGVTEGVLEEPAPGWYPLPPPPQPLVAAPAIQVQPHAAPIAGPSGQQRAQDEDVDMNGNQEDAEGSQEDEEEEEGDGARDVSETF